MFRALALRCLCVFALVLMSIVSLLPVSALSQSQGTNSAPPEKPVLAKPGGKEVRSTSALYAKIEDLDQKGFLKILRGDYFGTNRPRTLTRFEIAVSLQRMAAEMRIRTLSQDGTKLEYTFGIPHNLEVKQAQEMMDLWTEFGPELKQLGVLPQLFERISKTLQLSIAESAPSKT
jgi:hypothetical protein